MNKRGGVICHPEESRLKIYCSDTPVVFACPDKHVCRGHSKLNDFKSDVEDDADLLNGGIVASVAEFELAQCVREDQLDLDAFCEDELSKYYSGPKAWDGTMEERELMIDILPHEGVTPLGVVKLCNPFNIAQKQTLTCYFKRHDCAQSVVIDGVERCLPGKEISFRIDDCLNYDFCRNYKREDLQVKHAAKCIPPVDALCLDRFWNALYDDFQVQLGRLHVSSFLPFSRSIKFRFCDPFKDQKQLECDIEFSVIPVPAVDKPHALQTIDRERMKASIRSRFPDLFKLLYPAPMSMSSNEKLIQKLFSLKPVIINVNHLFCPDKPVFQSKVLGSESNLFETGQVCRQFSKHASRCAPKQTLKIGADDLFEDDATDEVLISPVRVESNSGFCAGIEKPGQYCLPGTPEVGILCPGGRLIKCKRSSPSSHAHVTDIGGESFRCVQRTGLIPSNVTSTDPFRMHKIVDIHGKEVSEGPWAFCGYLRDIY